MAGGTLVALLVGRNDLGFVPNGPLAATMLGGMGGVSFLTPLIGSLTGAGIYGLIKIMVGLRLTHEEEYNDTDLSIHQRHSRAGHALVADAQEEEGSDRDGVPFAAEGGIAR